MEKKAKIIFIASCAAFAASVYALAGAAAYRPRVVQPAPTVKAVSPADTPVPDEPPESTPDASDEMYRTKIIKLYRGRVAVFEEGADTPVKLLPTDVGTVVNDYLMEQRGQAAQRRRLRLHRRAVPKLHGGFFIIFYHRYATIIRRDCVRCNVGFVRF